MPSTDERRKRWEAEAGLRRFEPLADGLVLAAVERAERHRRPERQDEPGVPWWVIVDHLGFVNTGWTTRQLRPQVDGLVAGGLLEAARSRGKDLWAVTGLGRDRLAAWQRAGKVPKLPESPQHRIWRLTRTSAAELRS